MQKNAYHTHFKSDFSLRKESRFEESRFEKSRVESASLEEVTFLNEEHREFAAQNCAKMF